MLISVMFLVLQIEYATVSQVDLVPTISLLLGIPIPFSNLGTIIIDLFDRDPSQSNNMQSSMQQKLTALHLNAWQVNRFLHKYSEESNDLPAFELDDLDAEYRLAEDHLEELFSQIYSGKNVSMEELDALVDRYMDYLGRARGLCRSVWSKFDLVTMAVGGFVLVCAFLFNTAVAISGTKSIPLSTITYVAVLAVILFGVASLLQLLPPVFTLLPTVFATACILITAICKDFVTRLSWSYSHVKISEIFSILLCFSHSLSLLSNSFVVYEDRSSSFILQSLLILTLVVQMLAILSVVDSGAKRRVPKECLWMFVRVVLLVLAVACCLRLSTLFRSCREEQLDCEVSWFLQPLSAILLKFEHFRLMRLFISVASVISVIAVVTLWLRHCGNLNGLEPSVVAMRYVVPLSGFCLCTYWFVDGFMMHAGTSKLTTAGLTSLPRLVYALSLATVVVVAICPLCVFILRPRQGNSAEEERLERLQGVSHEELIAQIYCHVRQNWRSVLKSPDATRPSEDTPVVYGLATVYSSAHIVFMTAIAVVVMLVLGDNMAPSMAVLLACGICLFELHAAFVHCWSEEGKSIKITIYYQFVVF